MFFFFKQKTAYEMRISDWSSDVCSSDLRQLQTQQHEDHAIEHVFDHRPDMCRGDARLRPRVGRCALQVQCHPGRDRCKNAGYAEFLGSQIRGEWQQQDHRDRPLPFTMLPPCPPLRATTTQDPRGGTDVVMSV